MEFSQVGRGVPLEDAFEKVTGALKFAVDISLPGMLYAKALRSPYTHAKIVNIDVTKAEALPGVEAVITHRDVPEEEWMDNDFNYLGRVLDDRIRFVGDEVAAVAAVTEEIAEQAVDLIEVEYEELPHVFDVEEAMEPDAPLVNPHGNVRDPAIVEWGNLEEGFRKADHIVEYKTTLEAQQHAPVGLNACIAEFIGDSLTIWTSTQTPFAMRNAVAKLLKIPMHKLRIIGLPAGGSFGFWWNNNFHFLTIYLAKKSNKPVKMELTREETFSTVKRRDIPVTTVKLGVKNDGTFSAIHMKHCFDNGAYGIKFTPYETISDLWVHRLEHGRFEFWGVNTNLVTAGCMRGVGDLTEAFCMELVIDMAAEKIGMDPLEIRLKNMGREGDPQRADRFAYEGLQLPVPSKKLSSTGLDQCIMKGAEAAGWEGKWKGFGKPYEVDGPLRRAIGMGVSSHCSGQRYLGSPTVYIKLNCDGTVNFSTGVGRCGQGVETTQAQIIAEALGVSFEVVRGTHGDTETCGFAQATVASSNTHITGLASIAAARKVKRKVCELASTLLEAHPSDIDIKDSRVFVKHIPEKSIPLTDITNKVLAADGTAFGPTIAAAATRNIPLSPMGRMYMAHFADVEVDIETGKIRLLDYVAASDCGTVINPEIVENQVNGGVIMAAGLTLTERLIFDKNTGQILNPNFIDYKILRAADICDIESIFADVDDSVGAFGAKGIGEGVLTPVPAAIHQAVYNATGKRFNSLPMTPERVLWALRDN